MKYLKSILMSWLTVIAFDFFLHAGLLYEQYTITHPFLLDSLMAAKLIPLGYLSFLIQIMFLSWLIIKLNYQEFTDVLKFSLLFGGVIWASLILGMISISTIPLELAFFWFLGQTIELGIAGSTFYLVEHKYPHTYKSLILFILLLIISSIVLQNLG
ncbi:MAG: hypothetical protein INQ03_22415 [Candidatus Heimdallarchaeota archaeon]|nr:hypothetical protein [Candidatus Heimdallarchaeota archaeon]